MTIKQRNSAIAVAIITTIGSILVTYINGCFSSKASPSTKQIISNPKMNTGTQNNLNSQVDTGSINNNSGSGTQYNGPVTVNNLPLQSRKHTASKKVSSDTTIVNNGFINYGGNGNTYNQTFDNKPAQRHLNDEDFNKLKSNIKQGYQIYFVYESCKECEIFAKEIFERLIRSKYVINPKNIIHATIIGSPNEVLFKDVSVKLDDSIKTAAIIIYKQE